MRWLGELRSGGDEEGKRRGGEESYNVLKKYAFVDYSALQKQDAGNSHSIGLSSKHSGSHTLVKKSREPGPGAISKKGPVCDEVKVLDAYYSNHIQRFKDWMVHKRYSPSSIKTYIDGVKSFLLYISPKRYSDVCHEDMVCFVNDRVVCRGLSFSYQNQVVSAAKLFFREIVKSKLDVERFDRPRRQQKLPNVLSKHEVRKILTASANEKHRTMLAVIYACGLKHIDMLN